MDYAVRAHRQPLQRRAGAADEVVDGALLVEQVVRRLVSDDEERVLARADDDHRRDDHQRIRPVHERQANGEREHHEVGHHRGAGAPGAAAREFANQLRRERAPEVVLELFAAHRYLSMPPSSMYFTSRYSSSPYFEPSRPRPDCLTPPNGATSVEMMPTFAPTMPASMRSATRKMRPTSRL